MSIQELLQIVPPPRNPLEVGSQAEWRSVEAALGLQLPSDLYDLCSRYGSGWFMGVSIYNPFSKVYLSVIERDLQLYRSIKHSEGSRAVPFQLFPDKPGLFPCGTEENGGEIFWLVNGTPDQWPLVLFGDIFKWETKDVSITSFLAKSFKKELQCIWWDREWQEEEFLTVTFQPETKWGKPE